MIVSRSKAAPRRQASQLVNQIRYLRRSTRWETWGGKDLKIQLWTHFHAFGVPPWSWCWGRGFIIWFEESMMKSLMTMMIILMMMTLMLMSNVLTFLYSHSCTMCRQCWPSRICRVQPGMMGSRWWWGWLWWWWWWSTHGMGAQYLEDCIPGRKFRPCVHTVVSLWWSKIIFHKKICKSWWGHILCHISALLCVLDTGQGLSSILYFSQSWLKIKQAHSILTFAPTLTKLVLHLSEN